MSLLTKFIRRRFPRLTAIKQLLFKDDSYIIRSGWLRTLQEGRACDVEGNALPWMNYAVVDFLKQRLNSSMRIFEYGSGFSTEFYARYVASVISLEYDKEWYERVKTTAPQNATIIYTPSDVDGDYAHSIEKQEGLFDLVVIDGDDRFHAAMASLSKLSSAGVILLDDSDREVYRPVFEELQARGFKQISFKGLKPIDSGTFSTTLFYRCDNILGI